MEILEEVAPLLGSLAASTHVYAKWGAMSEATIAEQVFDLVMVAQADWAHQAVAGAVGPASARGVEAALEPVEAAGAIELMTAKHTTTSLGGSDFYPSVGRRTPGSWRKDQHQRQGALTSG